MANVDYGADERPALDLTEKGREEAVKLGASARLYVLTPKGAAWLKAQQEKEASK